MLRRLVQAMVIVVGYRARRLGQSGRNLLRPARTAVALAGAAGLDAFRPRSVLVAENALPRQQILVLRRTVSRPRLHREDRLILVLLARLNTTWRDALHLVEPDTLLRWLGGGRAFGQVRRHRVPGAEVHLVRRGTRGGDRRNCHRRSCLA